MSGHRVHLSSKPPREIFFTSSSLSFSSLSSSCSTSWDYAISTKDARRSCEYQSQQKGKFPITPSHVRMQPAPSPPSRLPPVQLMNKGLDHYDPERISASVFKKTGEGNWSEISNDSLFSITVDGCRMSNVQGFRISNIRPEEVMMPGEYLSYSPSLLGKLDSEDTEVKKRSEVKEIKSGGRSVESTSHQERSSSSTPVVPCNTNTSSFYSLYLSAPTKNQSFPLPSGEKKSKKRKKTKKSKKNKNKNKKKIKKSNCCMWSWLFSGFPKCESDLCCYKWRNLWCCCCGPKALSS